MELDIKSNHLLSRTNKKCELMINWFHVSYFARHESHLEVPMSYGKQIRLFLTDGDAAGVRYAELVNWTGQAFSLPWVSRTCLKAWDETFRPGVYVLFGLDQAGDDVAYIGESEHIFHRLATHASTSPLSEITSVVLFTSKDDNLTKGHVVFLERKLIDRAELA